MGASHGAGQQQTPRSDSCRTEAPPQQGAVMVAVLGPSPAGKTALLQRLTACGGPLQPALMCVCVCVRLCPFVEAVSLWVWRGGLGVCDVSPCVCVCVVLLFGAWIHLLLRPLLCVRGVRLCPCG